MNQRPVAIRKSHPRLLLDKKQVTRVVHLLDSGFRFTAADLPHLTPAARKRAKASPPVPAVPEGELSLAFLTDTALARIHAEFLDDPTDTDVITFEGEPIFGTAGEVCVSADTAARYAEENKRPFDGELTLYVVHGWLHLAGYDDLQPAKKRRMRAAEARAIRLLADAGAIPAFALKPAPARKPVSKKT